MLSLISLQVQEKFQSFLLYLRQQKNYSEHTISSYTTDIIYFLNFIAEYNDQLVRLSDLEKVDIRLIRSWLANRHNNNYSASSNNRALSAVKSFYRYLEKKEGVKCHDLYIIKPPKKPKILPKALTQEEASSAIDNIGMLGANNTSFQIKCNKAREAEAYINRRATSNDGTVKNGNWYKWLDLRNKALLTLIYSTGLRISEALSITKQHLENKQFIIIKGKGGKERLIPWLEQSRQLIELYLQAVPYKIEKEEPIFRGEKGGVLIRPVFNKELIKLRRSIGLPETLSSHSFRHSFATHLLENGANLRSIQDLLGHKSLSTTQLYTKINQNYLQSVYNKAHPDSKD